jgi:16S rRNA (guanine527-N7)-methyltransferase
MSATQTHRALLEKWRKAMDLVGPGPLEPHFEDAEQAVGWLAQALPPEEREAGLRGPWADLGSGAGFPGIALAERHPHAEVWLVERRQKRAAFLQQVVSAGKLTNARVFEGDSADLPARGFQGLVSRAYKPPEELLPEAEGLLAPGGMLVLLLAREPVPGRAGWRAAGEHAYTVEGKQRRAVALRWSSP